MKYIFSYAHVIIQLVLLELEQMYLMHEGTQLYLSKYQSMFYLNCL
jgi:hypothetical protein